MAERVLLTGGAGYIGSHTYVDLVQSGYDVVIVDDFSNARPDVLERLDSIVGANVKCVRLDIRDSAALARVFDKFQIDAVVHFAAKKAVGESVENPLLYFNVNVCGTLSLLDAMQAAGVFKLVYSSSCTVYSPKNRLPVSEDGLREACNPYGFTKLACERFLEDIAAADPRWQISILRYFNPAGAHPSGRIGENPVEYPRSLMPILAQVAVGRQPHIEVFGGDYDTPDGTAIRDYIHVSDLAQGHSLALKNLPEGGNVLPLNLGTGRGYSVLDLITAYSDVCGRKLPYRIVDRRPGDAEAIFAGVDRATAVLGFQARHGLEDMCQTSWRWIRSLRPN